MCVNCEFVLQRFRHTLWYQTSESVHRLKFLEHRSTIIASAAAHDHGRRRATDACTIADVWTGPLLANA